MTGPTAATGGFPYYCTRTDQPMTTDKAKPYSPPTLTVYGHVSQLTASGTGPHAENSGDDDLNAMHRQRP